MNKNGEEERKWAGKFWRNKKSTSLNLAQFHSFGSRTIFLADLI